jgi:tetratricopeptide (TPR) repeat protein
MKQYNEAFASIRRSLLADPTNSEAYQKALILTESKGFNAEAIELYNRLLDYDAYNWQAWMNLGYALSGLHKYEDAIEAFEFAFAINERCKEAYLEAGSLLVLKADYHRAIAVLENALFEAEDDALLMQQLGICYEKLKDYTTALSYYSRSHEIDPYDAETLFRMGRCAKAIGNWLQAIEAYENAIDIEDWREEYHAALGEAYEHLNQNSKAFYSYRKAATLARHDVFYWLQYTSFLMNIGQEKMALRALIQADKYVDDTAIEYMRIACLYEMGKKEEAIFRLREVLQSDFGNHIIMFRWRPYLRKSTELGAVIESFKN